MGIGLALWGWVFLTAPAAAGRIYSWTDDQGVIHISRDAPSETTAAMETHAYRPQRTQTPDPGKEKRSLLRNALAEQKARIESEMAELRRKAADARRDAERAVAAANALREETDRLINTWGRQEVQPATALRINRRIEATNKAIQEANQLIQTAAAAEKKVQQALEKAVAFNRRIATAAALRIDLGRP